MLIDEPVDVELSPSGAPVRFTWRGIHYGAVSAPEPWLAREAWWRNATRASRDARVSIERQMWRLDAVPLRTFTSATDSTFDLCHHRDGSWRLEQAWSRELDERLFA